jgi:hypothetical protein
MTLKINTQVKQQKLNQEKRTRQGVTAFFQCLGDAPNSDNQPS